MSITSTAEPVYLDLRTAAERKRCSVATIRRRIHSGLLPAIKNGVMHQVSVADLDAAFAPVAVVPKSAMGPRRAVNRIAAGETAMARLHAAAVELADAAPPLSADQRARLVSLLGGASR
jgi:hypothetical protein